MPLYMLIGYDNKTIPDVSHIKFHGITVDSTLSDRNHIDQLINKLNTASYVIHSVKSFVPHSTLIIVYYSLFLYFMTYGIIFWGILPIVPQFLRCKIGTIRIIMGCRSRYSCRSLFKELKILPLKSQYKFSLLLFHDKFSKSNYTS